MGRLLLWDIDGTLLTTRAVSHEALFAATAKVLGREFESVELKTAGKTDPVIVSDLLESLDVPSDDLARAVKMVLRAYGPELALRRKAIATHGQLFAGVREVLTAIDQTRTINTVLTGNIAVNATCKLDAFRISRHFDLEIGAYGSDNADRKALVDVVLNRVGDKRRKFFAEEEIWIIGDTPLDYEVAKANDTMCFLVANGRHSFEELEALKPDLVLPDLTDTDRILTTLLESQ